MLLPVMDNSADSGNSIVSAIVEILAGRLPPGWRASAPKPTRRDAVTSGSSGAVLRVGRLGGPAGSVQIETRTRLEPRDVDYLAATLRPTPERPVLVAAPFISPRTRERLRACGLEYVDLTGNVRLALSEPGLFIETTGADENPQPSPRERKSLKGAKAGRIVRALCDFRQPIGLRDLARRSGVDPGYASRVVDYLNREALVKRGTRGPVINVDWQALLRRWSQEYSPFQRQRVTMCLAPRGVAAVVDKLKSLTRRFAVSGSWAGAQFAPIAPSRLLLVYVDQPSSVVEELDLRPTDSGANVAVASPFDPVVYERTSTRSGITIAAPSQVAADLLTSPGRGPNESNALMEWMSEHEELWRA